MNTELEDRLRRDMERFADGLFLPPGLARRAYRRSRRRRSALRVAAASGMAAVLAAGAVAVAAVSGAFRPPSPPAPVPPARTTAYVLRHVEDALAPGRLGNLISVNRVTLPPGQTLTPAVGGMNGGPAAGGAGSPEVTTLLRSQYQDMQKNTAEGPGGQPVFDVGFTIANGSETETVVIYGNRTWWTATVPASPPAAPGCATGSITLSNGAGGGWPAFIRSQLACGAYAVTGREMIGGIDAIKITGRPGQLTMLVDPATYRPIRLTIGPMRTSFLWQRPTPARLAQLRVTVPAGFRRVPPPAGR